MIRLSPRPAPASPLGSQLEGSVPEGRMVAREKAAAESPPPGPARVRTRTVSKKAPKASAAPHAVYPAPAGGGQTQERPDEDFTGLFEFADEGIFEVTHDGRPIRVNPALARMLGYDSPKDLLANVQNVADLNADPTTRAEMLAALRSAGVVRDLEIQQRRKDGSLVWLSIIAHARNDSRGTPSIVGFLRDVTESRRAEEELVANEERYRSVVAAIAEGIILHDADGAVLECNASAEEILGLRRAEMMGHKGFDASLHPIHEDGTAFPAETHPTVVTLRTGAPCSRVLMGVHRPDGDLSWISINTQALIRVGEQAPYAVVASFADITDQRYAEAALRASAAAMRSSLDTMIDPFMICSSVRDDQGAIKEFRIDFANRAAGEFIGQAPETLVGAPIPNGMMLLRDEPFRALVRDIVESGNEWCEDAVDFALSHRVGDAYRGKLNIQIARFGDGFFAAWRDVTERETALTALRASEQRARELVDNSADGFLISDVDGHYVETNASMCKMLGYSREELLAMHAGDLTADDDPIGNAAMHKRLAEPASEAGFLTERRYRRADGTSLPVEIRFTTLPDGRQQRNVRDITDRLAAEAVVIREARIQVALTQALQGIAADATIEETAQALCDVLTTIPGVDMTALLGIVGEHEVEMIAGRVPASFPTQQGASVPPEQARHLQTRAAQGAWTAGQDDLRNFGPWGVAATESGMRAAAFGPVVYGGHVVGVLCIGTSDARYARILVERMPGLSAFTAAASGLLGERLRTRRREQEMRRRIGQIIASGAFHPVFQPIVDLATRGVVGYEALSRFDSGQRPDLCMADAWSVGLGRELELTTLEAAIKSAKGLPSGRWLSLNVSPRLLDEVDRLRALIWGAERPIVIEVTEHEIIDDYGGVRDAIRGLGNNVRLAVDDAGAGTANFGHIVELRPDLVKLDISLVRRVNADLGRQAMIVGMRHFSRTAGCRLVAEGIESEEEAGTLRGFGVEYGQGYLFGRPEPVESWATTGASV